MNNEEPTAGPDTSSKEETPKGKFERERMTRRAALAKFGIRSAAAVLGAMSIDDLARIAARTLERNATDNKVAQQVAREFRDAGVAFAEDDVSASGSVNPCDSGPGHDNCACNVRQKTVCLAMAETINCYGLTVPQCAAARALAEANCRKAYSDNCDTYGCSC